MVRNARRSRVSFVVGIALAVLMAAPIDECDDYAFLDPWASAAHAGLPDGASDSPNGIPDERTAHPDVCSCIVCDLAIADPVVPSLSSPQRGGLFFPTPAHATSSAYTPHIFRPPIA